GMLGGAVRAQQNGHIWEVGQQPASTAAAARGAPVNSWGEPVRSAARKETVRSQSPDFGSANPNPGPAPIPLPGGSFAPTPGVITGPPVAAPFYGAPAQPAPAGPLPFGSGASIGGDIVNPPGPDGGQLMPPGTLMQPFGEPEGLVNIIGQVQETQTGRFSVG